MKVWGLLRVKNEARWIARVLESILPVTDRILVLDDHSTDGTAEICDSVAEVYRSEFEGIHEARDKDWLLQKAWELGAELGDYCLMIDGDEILHAPDIPAVIGAMKNGWPCCTFHIVYLWDREDQVRVDRWYKEFRRPSLFRLTDRRLSFRRTAFGGNFHCSSAPGQLLVSMTPIPARLLHLGYLHREDRIRKYRWYNQVDPNNEFENSYKHVAQGDLPEIPASATLKWAGPLQLEKFCI